MPENENDNTNVSMDDDAILFNIPEEDDYIGEPVVDEEPVVNEETVVVKQPEKKLDPSDMGELEPEPVKETKDIQQGPIDLSSLKNEPPAVSKSIAEPKELLDANDYRVFESTLNKHINLLETKESENFHKNFVVRFKNVRKGTEAIQNDTRYSSLVGGIDDTRGYDSWEWDYYAMAKNFSSKNPYLNSKVRESIEKVSNKFTTEILPNIVVNNRVDLAIINAKEDLTSQYGSLSDSRKKGARGASLKNVSRALVNMQKIRGREDMKLDVTMTENVLSALHGMITPDAKTIEYMSDKYGVEYASVKDEIGKREEPSKLTFDCEGTTIFDREIFADNMSRIVTGAKENIPYPLSDAEKFYGVGTFDRNLGGIFGSGKNDYESMDTDPKHPMFLRKFTYIFVNGTSVYDACYKKMSKMSADEANEYMKCFVTAALVSRKSRVECALPPVKWVPDKEGIIHKEYAERDALAEPKIIPIVAHVSEPVKKNFWKDAVEYLKSWLPGWKSRQQKYERLLNRDRGKDDRHEDILEEIEKADRSLVTAIHGLERQERYDNQERIYDANKQIENKINSNGEEFFGKKEEPPKVEVKQESKQEVKGEPIENPVENKSPVVDDDEMFFNLENQYDEYNTSILPENTQTDVFDERAAAEAKEKNVLAMAYMYSKGVSADSILGALEGGIPDAKKLAYGKELSAILDKNDPKEMAQLYAKMAKSLADTELPKINYRDPGELSHNYKKLAFLSETERTLKERIDSFCAKDENKKAFEAAMGENGQKAWARTSAVTNIIRNSALPKGVDIMKDDRYSNFPDKHFYKGIRNDNYLRDEAARRLTPETGLDALNSMGGKKLRQLGCVDFSKSFEKMIKDAPKNLEKQMYSDFFDYSRKHDALNKIDGYLYQGDKTHPYMDAVKDEANKAGIGDLIGGDHKKLFNILSDKSTSFSVNVPPKTENLMKIELKQPDIGLSGLNDDAGMNKPKLGELPLSKSSEPVVKKLSPDGLH